MGVGAEQAPVKKTGKKPRVGDGTPGPGRPKGVPNKTTIAIKEAILSVYGSLQIETGKEHGHFLRWAKDNPTDFYKIASKLIPLDVNATVTKTPSYTVHDFVMKSDR